MKTYVFTTWIDAPYQGLQEQVKVKVEANSYKEAKAMAERGQNENNKLQARHITAQ